MIDLSFTDLVFATGLIAGVTLDLLLLRTLLAPPFRIWPTPEPGSWQSLTFWGLFRGGMVMTFVDRRRSTGTPRPCSIGPASSRVCRLG